MAKAEKRLPYLGADVTNRASFQRIIESLANTICSAIREGKSVTATNKALIHSAALEIITATDKYFDIVSAEEDRYDPNFNSPDCYKNVVTDINKTIKEEIANLRSAIKADSEAVTKTISTYASIASRHTQVRDTPGPAPTSTPRIKKPAAATPPITRPALVVASKTPVSSREETLRHCKNTISFRECNYAPARVVPISKDKLRFEFDSERDRDDALQRISRAKDPKISAVVANRLKPMAILKGIANDVAGEDLVEIILRQNPELSEFNSSHIQYKFKRDNRNSALYNVVFVTHPSLFRALLALERVRIDYQRVHVEEFSPFLQCHACLQFGHTSTHCKSSSKRCAHCAEEGHIHKECHKNVSVAADGSITTNTEIKHQCYNCTSHNSKFNNKYPTDHMATSYTCPIVRAMRNRTRANIDYGSAPTPSVNRDIRVDP
ncbi:unnamed protein product [Euphydryas editha]|uniref:CCHC-type domain-containing protein n=1 Tax=Euphydryas editha TaxID=104508 RepID=A0AAU9TN81_EUPED|nr:unnamed protein product [Euphydryas editha]